MLKINVQVEKEPHPVYLGRNIVKELGRLMAERLPPGPCLLVSDCRVAKHYEKACRHSLQEGGFKPFTEVLAGGERIKTLASAERLYRRALEAGLDRRSAVVALGGGVIGDLAGFMAATYLRGIPLVQVPTTLLALVDSSVGGKVAVNHPLGKNLIGAFHQPTIVLGDTAFLATLPLREWKAGMAELIKYGVISDARLFDRLELLPPARLQQPRGEKLQRLIARAVQLKSTVVSRDEKEQDYRRILNFGHTFGHALEAATDYAYYLHGEAVAVGMQMAAIMARALDILDPRSAERIIRLAQKLEPPPPPPRLDTAAVQDALFYDKKKVGQKLVFVLPQTIGRVGFYSAVPEKVIREPLVYYLEGDRGKGGGPDGEN